MAYTDTTKVAALLGGVSITASTVPSTTDVNQWIAEIDSQIELIYGKVYASTAFSSVIVDYDGSGSLRLPFAPVISISSLEYESNGLGSDSANWVSLTEGRNDDYILYNDDGEIMFFGNNRPVAGYQNIRVTGVKGYATIPDYIVQLSTLLTAKKFIQSTVNSSARKGGRSISVGTISLSSPSNFSISQINNINKEVDSILSSTISSSHVYRPSRRYSLQ